MLSEPRMRERLMAVFLLGVMLFTPPVLAVFNKATRVLGLPALYLYLFMAWGIVIALVALTVRWVDSGDDFAESNQEGTAKENGRGAGEPSDA